METLSGLELEQHLLSKGFQLTMCVLIVEAPVSTKTFVDWRFVEWED